MSKGISKFLVAACVVLAAAAAAQASVIYQQTFDNTTGAEIHRPDIHSDYGWTAHFTTGGNYSDNTDWQVSDGEGDPHYGTTEGWLYAGMHWGAGDTTRTLLWTPDVNVDVSEITEVNWWQANSHSDHRFQVALRMDGAWYVSELADAQEHDDVWGDDVATLGSRITFEFDGKDWYELNFDGDFPNIDSTVGLSIGDPTSLPGGTVAAIGLYIDGNAEGRRIDTFTVIPEPATLAVLGIGGLGVLLRRRRS